MRTVIAFFIALLAIPVAQVAIDLWIERPGPYVLMDRSAKITISVGKYLRTNRFE